MLDILQHTKATPPVVTTTLRTKNGQSITVARDDLLTGGTKERALWGYLADLHFREFIYASPFSGFAQIALAYVSQQMGRHCIIIAQVDPNTGLLHPYSIRARDLGATVFSARNLEEAEEIAERLAADREQTIKIPLGFDVPEFRQSMASVLSVEWERIEKKMPEGIRRLWLPVGSGTLASSFLSFLPSEIEVKGLNVRVLKPCDPRIIRLDHSIDMKTADVPFHEKATILPKIPSNLFYDAKLWRVIEEEGRDGDVWWNVAG